MHVAAEVGGEDALVEVERAGDVGVHHADAAEIGGTGDVHRVADRVHGIVVAIRDRVDRLVRQRAAADLPDDVSDDGLGHGVAGIGDHLLILLLLVGDAVEVTPLERDLLVLVDRDRHISEEVARILRARLVAAIGLVVVAHGRHSGDVGGVGLPELEARGAEVTAHAIQRGHTNLEGIKDVGEDFFNDKSRHGRFLVGLSGG